MSSSRVKFRVFVDFDGTIAPDDPTDRLFAAFADPKWLEFETAFQAGEIPSSVCMGRQVELLDVEPSELDGLIEATRVDPAFHGFVDMVRAEQGQIVVVSDGFDRVVGGVLKANGLTLPYFANRLEHKGDGAWNLSFPYARASCKMASANCKCSHAVGSAHLPCLVVGDGRSDICIAERADFVIAKGRLAEHCAKNRLNHATFATFEDVIVEARSWLGGSREAQRATAGQRRRS